MLAARPALRMHAMDGLLLDGAPLAGIAASHGTPTWVYGADTIRARLRRLKRAMPGIAIHYAAKALDHLAILSLFAEEGIGADVVSGGELLRAAEAGIAASRIVFSGVGKTQAELRLALERGVGQINVESAEELAELSAIAQGLGCNAPVALRVNPDVAVDTHDKIATGRAGDKFGIPFGDAAALYALAATLPGIVPVGLAVHIGSQLHDMAAYRAAYARVAGLVAELRRAGLSVQTVDCGGGLGVAYNDEIEALPEAWAGAIRRDLGHLDLHLAIEPGRWLTAPAGVLLASVIRTRRIGLDRPIVILDAAMNDLARPSLYGAWHGIMPVSARDLTRPQEIADIAGPVCESSDFFARARPIAPMQPGALVAILDAGAYGASMSSSYNARPAAAEILVQAGTACLITPRQNTASLWQDEVVPHRAPKLAAA
jgi:diaminopimelate decarboxylase